MKQLRNKEYKENAASREDKPRQEEVYNGKDLLQAKHSLSCKDNYLIYKFKFSLSLFMVFVLECPAPHNISLVLYWNPALPFCKKSIPQHLSNHLHSMWCSQLRCAPPCWALRAVNDSHLSCYSNSTCLAHLFLLSILHIKWAIVSLGIYDSCERKRSG